MNWYDVLMSCLPKKVSVVSNLGGYIYSEYYSENMQPSCEASPLECLEELYYWSDSVPCYFNNQCVVRS
jgi:hypothetical protein